MKMHSYMSINGYLQFVSVQSQATLDDLREAAESTGGWDHALREAKAHRDELDAATGMSNSTRDTREGSPIGTPPIPAGQQASYVDASTANVLRKRLAAMDQTAQGNGEKAEFNGHSPEPPKRSDDPPIPSPSEPHPLIDHPNEHISNLAKELSELEGELCSSGPEHVVWPNNITWKNFAVYQLIPTLVYELEYPRTERSASLPF